MTDNRQLPPEPGKTANSTTHREPRTPHRHYRFHQLALSPLLAKNPLDALTTVKNSIREPEQKPFLLFIMQNGLGPLWHELLQHNNIQSFFSPEFTRELRNITSHTASLYLFQKIALEKIDAAFTKHSVPYAVFKGAHTRELIYQKPEMRYACDIDILVSKPDKAKAITALGKAGFSFQPKAENISHEASLTDDRVSIDLHWDILRPGRTKKDMTGEFLKNRKKNTDFWALNSEATLFILLVHPVFTKYATAPQSSLLHLLDLHYWIQKQEIDWKKIEEYLEQGGGKTAAWISAIWLEMLTGTTLPESFMRRIKPSSLKTWYLQIWLEKNLSTRLLNHPILIQAGFTLPAHDRISDVIRFLKQIRKEKKEAPQKIEELLDSTK